MLGATLQRKQWVYTQTIFVFRCAHDQVENAYTSKLSSVQDQIRTMIPTQNVRL